MPLPKVFVYSSPWPIICTIIIIALFLLLIITCVNHNRQISNHLYNSSEESLRFHGEPLRLRLNDQVTYRKFCFPWLYQHAHMDDIDLAMIRRKQPYHHLVEKYTVQRVPFRLAFCADDITSEYCESNPERRERSGTTPTSISQKQPTYLKRIDSFTRVTVERDRDDTRKNLQANSTLFEGNFEPKANFEDTLKQLANNHTDTQPQISMKEKSKSLDDISKKRLQSVDLESTVFSSPLQSKNSFMIRQSHNSYALAMSSRHQYEPPNQK